jgi:hypothetical protein
MTAQENNLYTLIPLEDFKALLGIDDREDKLTRYCLVTSTFTIEQYCMRRLLRKKHFERIEYSGDLILPLREYPISKALAVYVIANNKEEILESDFYSVVPYSGTDEDLPFYLSLSSALKHYRNLQAIKAVYWAGYQIRNEKLGMRNEKRKCEVPQDLATACLELASWNMNRYRGRRVGMTGNVRGNGKDGEHFELSMPENVRLLLEPYKRKIF